MIIDMVRSYLYKKPRIKEKNKKKTLSKLLEFLDKEHAYISDFLNRYAFEARYCTLQNGSCKANELVFWEKDKNGVYIYANKNYLNFLFDGKTKIYGKTDHYLIERHVDEITWNSSLHKLFCIMDEFIKKDKTIQRFIAYGIVDNTFKFFDVTRTPLIINNNYIGIRGVGVDITEKMKQLHVYTYFKLQKNMFGEVYTYGDAFIYVYKKPYGFGIFK